MAALRPPGGGPRRTALLPLLLLLAACLDGPPSVVPHVAGGDAERGRELIWGYTCGGCHEIPGVAGAHGQVGPPLTDWAERRYIVGALWNEPAGLIRFLMDPSAVEPGTGMPAMGVTEEEARHMAAYLYTLGDTRSLGPPHPFPLRWLERLGHTGAGGRPGAR